MHTVRFGISSTYLVEKPLTDKWSEVVKSVKCLPRQQAYWNLLLNLSSSRRRITSFIEALYIDRRFY